MYSLPQVEDEERLAHVGQPGQSAHLAEAAYARGVVGEGGEPVDEPGEAQGVEGDAAVEGFGEPVPGLLQVRRGPAQQPCGPQDRPVGEPGEALVEPLQPRVPVRLAPGVVGADEDVGAGCRRERVLELGVEHRLYVGEEPGRGVQGALGHVREPRADGRVADGHGDGAAGRALPQVDQDLDLGGAPGQRKGDEPQGSGRLHEEELPLADGPGGAAEGTAGPEPVERGDRLPGGVGRRQRAGLARGDPRCERDPGRGLAERQHRGERPARGGGVADPGGESGQVDGRLGDLAVGAGDVGDHGPRGDRFGERDRGRGVVDAARLDVAHQVLPGVRLVRRVRHDEVDRRLAALHRHRVLRQHQPGGQGRGHEVPAGRDGIRGGLG